MVIWNDLKTWVELLFIGWRNEDLDLISLYSQLEMYSGGMPGHATPTVLSCDEIADCDESGRSGIAIGLTDKFVNLRSII